MQRRVDPDLRAEYAKHRPNVERAVAQVATRADRAGKVSTGNDNLVRANPAFATTCACDGWKPTNTMAQGYGRGAP